MLYKYCNIKGFDILINKRLRLGRIDGFNDPFELLLGVDEKSASYNVRLEYANNPDSIVEYTKILDSQDISFDNASHEDVLQKMADFKLAETYRTKKSLWDIWCKDLGIICLSEKADIIQMWAHYADNHRGIVVGIEENEITCDKNNLITVCYRDNLPMLPIHVNEENFFRDSPKYILETIGRKESHWAYEKEIRIFGKLDDQDADGHYYADIPSFAIKELYLGLNSDDKTKRKAISFKKMREFRHLKVFLMAKAKNSFALEWVEA